MSRPRKEMLGLKFGRLTVVKRVNDYVRLKGERQAKWLCICECNNKVEVVGGVLRRGDTLSCGCLRLERITKHGYSKHALYSVYMDMKKRCYNPKNNNYENYGGRGIKICNDWELNPKSFIDWSLANGYKKELQIDRINNNGDYEPSNCRYVVSRENVLNKRLQKRNKSGYTGVYQNKKGLWWGSIFNKGNSVYFGIHKTKKDILEIRNKYIVDNNLHHKIQEWRG